MSYNEVPSERVKVETLNPRSRRIYSTVKVVSKNPIREVTSRRDGSQHNVTEVLVGDETGSVFLTLWDDAIEQVNDGDIIDIDNAYVTLFRGNMRLNLGRFGSMTPSEANIEEVNTENNLSNQQHEQEGYGGYRRPYGGGGRGYSDRGGRRPYFR
jgi:replication factor A1